MTEEKFSENDHRYFCCCGKLRMHILRAVSFLAKKEIITGIIQTITYIVNCVRNKKVDYALTHVITALIMIPCAILAILVCSGKRHRKYLIAFMVAIPLTIIGSIIAIVHDIEEITSGRPVCTNVQNCGAAINLVGSTASIVLGIVCFIFSYKAYKYLELKEIATTNSTGMIETKVNEADPPPEYNPRY